MYYDKKLRAKLLAKRNQLNTTVKEKEIENPSVFRTLWGIVKHQYPNNLEGAKDVSIEYLTSRRFSARFKQRSFDNIIDTIEQSVTVSSLLLYYTILIKKYEHYHG